MTQSMLQELLDKFVELVHELGFDIHDGQIVTAEEKGKHYQQ